MLSFLLVDPQCNNDVVKLFNKKKNKKIEENI